MRNDPEYIESAESCYIVHMFASRSSGNGIEIEKLLPKSGDSERPDLAEIPTDQWDSVIPGMNSRTRITVERMRIHFIERTFFGFLSGS